MPAVLHHVPGTDGESDLTVGQVKAVIARHGFHRLEIENLLVELGDMSRPAAADANVVDPARLFPAELDIALAHVVHALLREVPLVAVGVMAAQPGKRHVALTLVNVAVGVKLFEPVAHDLDVFDGEAEVIEAGSKAWLAL
jgi:hypothetical protein